MVVVGLQGAVSSPEIETIIEGTPHLQMSSSLDDARRTRRRVTPRASTAQHRDAMRLNETHPLMRCVSRVEVEPQEACLSNLLRTSFADRARIMIIIVSRAVGSGKRRETQERNEKKNKKKLTLDTKQGRIELVTARDRSSSISGLRP